MNSARWREGADLFTTTALELLSGCCNVMLRPSWLLILFRHCTYGLSVEHLMHCTGQSTFCYVSLVKHSVIRAAKLRSNARPSTLVQRDK